MSDKVPFIKAKDARAEIGVLKQTKETTLDTRKKAGDALLRRILTSLSKGRADDQRAVAEIARELVELGLYGN